jgi:hypothetical protein
MGSEEINISKDIKINAETKNRGLNKNGRDGKKQRMNKDT